MQDLIRKIEADAAARLRLPEGKSPAQELGRYKTFLKIEAHRLKMLHRAGAPGLQICHGRAHIIDVLLRYLWDSVKAGLSEQARKEFPQVSLVAIGGYGRGELNPYSDIDLMFLQNRQVAGNRPLPYLSKIIEGILYPLYDVGLKVGHSVRSVEDCGKVANSDMQSKTSLIESRLVTGDEPLFNKFQKTLMAKCVEDNVEEYIAMRLEDQTVRRAKFGNSACMQEPNIKNGCGGLRDYQNLLWMAFFKYQTRSLRELEAHSLVHEQERKQLEAAYNFLMRVRTEMHYHTNRPVDVLSKNLQPAVAHNLGYRERSPSQRIERFMRDLYMHSRNILLITRTLEQRMALSPAPSRLAAWTALLPGRRKPAPQIVDGFKITAEDIRAAAPNVFREQPQRLMRVFLYAQQRGLRLHPDLSQLIRSQLSLVDKAFLSDPHVRESFLAILNQRGSVAPALRAMHEVDFLGKYMPEFGKLTCLVQHEFYHQYAADEHTLMCLEQLDRIWEAKDKLHAPYSELFHKLERPALLYLALLLHDTGKPNGHGDHTTVSGQLAMRASKRLALDGASSHTLRLIIENHLLMASVSQRRDLDDPAVIRQFAKQLQNTEHLSLLTLHTYVDSMATSDKLWNGFKDSLLWSLYNKALGLLVEGTEFVRAEEKQRELLQDEVRRDLPKSIPEEELQAHFGTLPARYAQIHSAKEVLKDLVLAHEFMRLQISDDESALKPVVHWHDEPDRGYNQVKLCTWDRAGLFSKIAGCFSATGLNILTAQVFTRMDGIALDTWAVTDARSGSPAGEEQRQKFEELLNKALNGDQVKFESLITRQKSTRPVYQAYSGEQIPTQVRFDNEASETRTLVEIETEDRLGLLYAMARVFTELSLDIVGAKILTERGAAIDSFYIREVGGLKVTTPERQKAIERKLRQALAALAPQ